MKAFWIGTGTFVLVVAGCGAPLLAQRAANSAAVATAPAARLSGFNVVLVEGDLRGAIVAEGLPAVAAKALADVKDFLPYKGYQLLDSQWILGSTGQMAVQLRGPADQVYHLELESSYPYYGSDVPAPLAATSAPQIPRVAIRRFQLRAGSAAWALTQGDHSPGFPASVLSAPASLIETSFRMDVGETVVVGTSRLQGDKALIVLLTAVPR